MRGLSVRDVENTLADALGAEAALSKSTVSRVCQAIAELFAGWSERRLDDLELDYLFLDASMFKMHPAPRRTGARGVGHHHRRRPGVRRLADMRQELLDPPTQIRAPKIDTDTTPAYSVGAVA